jgi:hypothetical protein
MTAAADSAEIAPAKRTPVKRTATGKGRQAVDAALQSWRTDDELRRARTVALGIATDVARDRANVSGTHPGADAILVTAGEYFDFIWNGGKP